MTRVGAVALRRVWLWLTLALFCAWIVWLGTLAFTKPVVLVRTQFLVADVVVIGQVQGLDQPVTVEEVAWAHDGPGAGPAKGQAITVTNLADCKQDWRGAGQYILPLLRTGENQFEVADPTGRTRAERQPYLQKDNWPPSDSPGYYPYDPETKAPRPPHIYPVTRATLEQLRQIHPKP